MKANRKSALIRALALSAAMLALNACDSFEKIDWPHVYGPNEVPESVVSEPRAVATLPPLPHDTTYPRLGDVPLRPKNFSTPAMIDQTKQDMDAQRYQADEMKVEYESAADPTQPVPVPPPPPPPPPQPPLSSTTSSPASPPTSLPPPSR
jgi:hypothetical protein